MRTESFTRELFCEQRTKLVSMSDKNAVTNMNIAESLLEKLVLTAHVHNRAQLCNMMCMVF
jgi:hypothetical protein